MLHRNRIWTIAEVVDAETLAEQLTQSTWCSCNGFQFGDYLFVNDSTGPDGAQEYAALKLLGEGYMQVESLTFSWMTREKALDIIRRVIAGEFDHEHYGTIERKRMQTPAEHGHHCA